MVHHEPLVDIVMPTFNNEGVLFGAVSTILQHTMTPYRCHIVNNGDPLTLQVNSPLFKIHDTGKNLGWMGGVNHGAKQGSAPYILFINDDIQVIDHQSGWLNRMIRILENDPEAGVVVPMSNNAMHLQNMFIQGLPHRFTVDMVSGFCVLVRRDLFEKLGGLDESLSGGDDIDFSIRVRDAGYDMVVARDVFIFHRGQVTGKKLYGSHWNSPEYKTQLDKELIVKHGFKRWLETVTSKIVEIYVGQRDEDFETKELDKWLKDTDKILDVGCGGRKVHPKAVGVDIVPKGEKSYPPTQCLQTSVADYHADFTDLPFEDGAFDTVASRHTLEHTLDLLSTLREWNRVLKPGGLMVLALPDEDVTPGIPLDPTHVHAFTKESAKTLLEAIGLEVISNVTPKACYSFVIVGRKNG